MISTIEDGLFPFGEMKGKKIKDLDSEFVKEFVKSNAYKKINF